MNFLKHHILIIIIAAVASIGVISYTVWDISGNKQLGGDPVSRMTLTEEVRTTGKTQAAQAIDLTFERAGKVSRVYANVGDKVGAGQTLVTLENSEFAAQILQAEANVESEKAKLSELEKGTKEEEIQSFETRVSNAERSLADAEKNLEIVKQKAEVNLTNVYNNALTSAQDAISAGKIALLTVTDIQYAHFNGGGTLDSYRIADAKAAAVYHLLGAANAGQWGASSINPLEGGAFGTVKNAVNDSTHENMDQALTETIDSLQKVKQALDAIPVTDLLTATEKINLTAEKNNINSKITSVSGKRGDIAVQKSANTNSISAAESTIVTAQNTLDSAKSDLTLKRARVVPEEIDSQKARVKSAQANVQYIRAQIAKTIVRSPINGIIALQDAKAGEIVSPSKIIISLISQSKFEINAYVSEADVAKIKIGGLAKVSLDAYSNQIIFDAHVTKIDPVETVVNGVASYGITFQFDNADERIKSGMTANINIETAKRENALAVPERAVIIKDNNKFILVVTDNSSPEERKIETGIKGSNGYVEILSGINEGDRLINFGAIQ